MHSQAAPGRRGKKGKRAAASASAEPLTDGKTVGMFRFGGAEAGLELRGNVVATFQGKGYSVKSVALEMGEASAKVKCKAAEAESPECLAKVGEWLGGSAKTAADYLVFGGVTPGHATVTIFDVKSGKIVKSMDSSMTPGDLIVPIVLPKAVVTAVEENINPPGPATDEEKAVLAALDEPDKTPEELAAEKQEIADAQAAVEKALQDQVLETGNVTADLVADFDDFCRTGKRKKRENKESPKDLRPSCKRGTFWGYWQPRTWVALTLTIGTGAATGLMYGLALGARGPYKDAVDAVDAFPGDPRNDPNDIVSDGQAYDALATEVSQTGATMRRRAIVGDVLLGSTVLLAGVMGIMIFQDRGDAKRYIKEEKALRSISNVRVGPMLTKETKGAGLGFSF